MKDQSEFGDFQTPLDLARQVCRILSQRGFNPTSIVEPTCGVGNFLVAALDQFPSSTVNLGMEINPEYVEKARTALQSYPVRILSGDFFQTLWSDILCTLPEPILIIGNPPWITNAQLGVLRSHNLPVKTNFQNYKGFDALTGKSNFDISEVVIIKFLELLNGRKAYIAMLCKNSVARKVLTHTWKNGIQIGNAEIHIIDTSFYFKASVEACTLICELSPSTCGNDCYVYFQSGVKKIIGYRDGQLIADIPIYEKWKHLSGGSSYKWRSGVKHDCSKVMELHKEKDYYRNRLGEEVELEKDYIYPMLKSSEISRKPTRYMLVTQKSINDNTEIIKTQTPKTWRYLQDHGDLLDHRASSIYRNRPRFCVFGVGEYTFYPWKVAISGFYKKLQFSVVGPSEGKPVVFDDTIYFLPFSIEKEACRIAALLNSKESQEFFSAFIFWDNKRPITAEIFQRLKI